MNDEAVRRRNIQQVQAFFQSERQLNLEAWSAIWADNAIRRTPFAPPGSPENCEVSRPSCRLCVASLSRRDKLAVHDEIFPTTDPGLIVARATSFAEMRNGVTYENEVVAFFRFDDTNRIVEAPNSYATVTTRARTGSLLPLTSRLASRACGYRCATRR